MNDAEIKLRSSAVTEQQVSSFTHLSSSHMQDTLLLLMLFVLHTEFQIWEQAGGGGTARVTRGAEGNDV